MISLKHETPTLGLDCRCSAVSALPPKSFRRVRLSLGAGMADVVPLNFRYCENQKKTSIHERRLFSRPQPRGKVLPHLEAADWVLPARSDPHGEGASRVLR